MRRVMLLAAMLAMGLAAAAPAFGQDYVNQQADQTVTAKATVTANKSATATPLVRRPHQCCATTFPTATGQSTVNQQADQSGVVDDSVCSQVYNIAVQQYNAGDQSANADAFADADASAGPFGTAAAAAAVAGANAANIANAAGINIDTVNVCLNNFTVTATPTAKKTVTATAKTVHAKKPLWVKGKKVIPEKVIWVKGKKHLVVVKGNTVTATSTSTSTSTSAATSTATPTATAKTLPETGGASLLALGAGALLVGGGLVARRIAR